MASGDPLRLGDVCEYAAMLAKSDRQELLDRQPVGTGPFQLQSTAPGSMSGCNVTPISGAAHR
jgi:MarR-like DNA-binding transcriptional regulator SgrR of sgrS sRNA